MSRGNLNNRRVPFPDGLATLEIKPQFLICQAKINALRYYAIMSLLVRIIYCSKVKRLKNLFSRIWDIAYNCYHDQLMLSSGSDSKVVLSSSLSVSSEMKNPSDSEGETDQTER